MPEDGAETARPTIRASASVRVPQGHDEKRKKTGGRRHGIPPHTPPAVPPDFLNFQDFQQKKSELQSKTSANENYGEYQR